MGNIESIKGTYYCTFDLEYNTGNLILFDINNGIQSNQFELSDSIINMLLENSVEIRIFFADSKQKTIMEITPQYFTPYLYQTIDSDNADLINDIKNLNHEIIQLNQNDKIPLISQLPIIIPNLRSIMNLVDQFDIDPDYTDKIVGIWRYDTAKSNYVQIFPESEEEEGTTPEKEKGTTPEKEKGTTPKKEKGTTPEEEGITPEKEKGTTPEKEKGTTPKK